ncbi:phage tail assembly protein [Alicycliphilus denitrificans]|uniref:phage tail assembly protein n=1 Tax=Alicycliphilus denitrificans TaxID=179636 RepID=UPI0001D9FEAB|nr:phage tail assembly protein [Alicycliphilus denitrificans]ADU99021.1 tail E family protein [Alicycliphilus denitrificans BC]
MTEKTQPSTPAGQTDAAATAVQNADMREVILDVPLQRPGGELRKVLIRKPNAGALRGLSLIELLNMNTTALQTIIPRITEPMIHKPEVNQIDPADLVAIGTEVAGFLVPKAQREAFPSE